MTATSVTLAFRVEDASGGAVDAAARVRVDGELRAVSEGGDTRLLRIENLPPGEALRIEIEVAGADPVAADRYFPESVSTLPAPRAQRVATFATLNDLHFGEPRFAARRSADR